MKIYKHTTIKKELDFKWIISLSIFITFVIAVSKVV